MISVVRGCRRLYDWAPYMSVDMQWFIKGLYLLLRDTVMSLQSDGDTASAIMERYVLVLLSFFGSFTDSILTKLR